MAELDARIASLTKEEKARFLRGQDNWNTYGVKRLDIAPARMSDGPIGIRKVQDEGDMMGVAKTSICYPSGALLAASFDADLLAQVGSALAEEAKAYGVQILLGPAMNIKRSPLGGRGFEYYSEDPYLTGYLTSAYVKALEENGVGASVKHFAANSQESSRFVINEVIDERALNELYLKGFRMTIMNAKPATAMMSYNQINGFHSTENPYLMNQVLREEWSYQGVTISDWMAVLDPVKSLLSGLDIEMPNSNDVNYGKTLIALSTDPQFEKKTDEAIDRIIRMSEKYQKQQSGTYDLNKHHQLAVKAAEESIILLKNQDGILPLRKEERIVVIGDFAIHPRYQGGGSSHINPYEVDDLTKFLSAGKFTFSKGYHLDEREDDSLVKDALEKAKRADKVVMYLGVPEALESEGFDRANLRLPKNQMELIDSLYEVNHNLILILMSGGPLEMPFYDKAKGIFETYLGGEGVNEALYHLLYGEKNPCGHLAETFPVKLEDTPCLRDFPGDATDVLYRESIYVGYRYYETYHIKPLFPFGFGLSYTEFSYSDVSLVSKEDGTFVLSCRMKNIGSLPGKGCAQFYVSKPNEEVFNPQVELCGVATAFLQPGEEKEVTSVIHPNEEVFSYYHFRKHAFVPLYGTYRFGVGSDSEHVNLSLEYRLKGTNLDVPYERKALPFYFGNSHSMNGEREFEKLFNGPLPKMNPHAPFSLDTSFYQASLRGSKGAKLFMKIMSGIEPLKSNRMFREQVFLGPIRCLIYMIPKLGGRNIKHLFGLLNDHHYRYHLLCLGILMLKGRKGIAQ